MSRFRITLLLGVVLSTALSVAGAWAPPATRAATSLLPQRLAIYYGQPSAVNGAAGNVTAASAVFGAYDSVVLGDSLEFPQASTQPGQPAAAGEQPYYGCDQNRAFDHANTQQIIQRLKQSPYATKIYGYISVGGENTNRLCPSATQPGVLVATPLSMSEIQNRVLEWKQMGVAGIFLDEAEYGFGAYRQRQNDAVDYVHGQGLKAFINGFNPDDDFQQAVVGTIVYGGGTLAGQTSSVAMNPSGLATHLTGTDTYLLEHYQVIDGAYAAAADWTGRANKAFAYKQQFGTHVATVTTLATSDAGCTTTFDQAKLDYAWWSTLLYGFDAMAWGEPNGYSSWGPCSNQLPLHSRPAPTGLGGLVAGSTVWPQPNGVYTRATTTGAIAVDTTAHTGSFAAVTHFGLSAPATAKSDQPFSVTVQALDASNRVVPGYASRITFDSSDSHATTPNDYTFTPADGGAHAFSFALETVGVQTVQVMDWATGSITGSVNVTVSR